MKSQYILSRYISRAISTALIQQLEDSSYVGRVPSCAGVIAFAPTLHACKHELHSVFEEWVLLGLKMGHPLPIIAGIDLNYKPLDAVQA